MRVKNLISYHKTQQSFGNDFKQALPPQIIRKLRSFQYLLHRDSERRYKNNICLTTEKVYTILT